MTAPPTDLNVVSSPGGVPQPPGGDAGQAAAEQGAAEGRVVETDGILADLTGATPGSETTDPTVITAVYHTLVPGRHVDVAEDQILTFKTLLKFKFHEIKIVFLSSRHCLCLWLEAARDCDWQSNSLNKAQPNRPEQAGNRT